MSNSALVNYLLAEKLRLLDVSYDLRVVGQDYPGLTRKLEGMVAVRIQQSKWWVVTPLTATAMRNELLSYIDGNDSLLVEELSGDVAGWEPRPPLRDWMNMVLASRAA